MTRTNKYNRIEWIGRPWDGVSDIAIGEEPWDGESNYDQSEPLWDGRPGANYVVPAAEATLLVAELRRLIAERPLLGVALPDHSDVRACLTGPEGTISEPTRGRLTVDFDLGGMILPLCIEDWQLRADIATPMPRVAHLMVGLLVQAAKHRKRLLRRELQMRSAFESILAEIGDGAAPLWLRMQPLGFSDAGAHLRSRSYVALDISLDHRQVWAPSGLEQVDTVAELSKANRHRPIRHARNVARLAEMHATDSIGWISDIALALIDERGLSPAAVFRMERDAGLRDHALTHYGVADSFGALFCFDGVLSAYFTFDQGDYKDGCLTLDGGYPETLAIAAPGRPLAAYVDHPAFVASGAIITGARAGGRAAQALSRTQALHGGGGRAPVAPRLGRTGSDPAHRRVRAEAPEAHLLCPHRAC